MGLGTVYMYISLSTLSPGSSRLNPRRGDLPFMEGIFVGAIIGTSAIRLCDGQKFRVYPVISPITVRPPVPATSPTSVISSAGTPR